MRTSRDLGIALRDGLLRHVLQGDVGHEAHPHTALLRGTARSHLPEIRDILESRLRDVVEGTAAHKDELEQTVSSALAKDWTWGRIDRLVRAILLAGAYELVHRRDVPPKVAINEYVEIAHAFYDKSEPTFINSVLDRVARQERSAELTR